MSTKPTSRPWYCNDALTEDYKTVARSGGDLEMLKALKIVRSLIVNAGIISTTLFGLWLGFPPWFGALGLITLGLYNGVEVADYAALAQAFVEVKTEAQPSSTDSEEPDD